MQDETEDWHIDCIRLHKTTSKYTLKGPTLLFTRMADSKSESSDAKCPTINKFLSELNLLDSDGKIRVSPNTNHVKLDIGLSHMAPHSREWLQKEQDLTIFGFEPHPENVNSIRRTMPSHYRAFNLLPCALSSKEGTWPLFCTEGDAGCSSLYEPIEAGLHLKIERKVDVPVFRLDSFFALWPWDRFPLIEYIKIDAQGSDLDILKSAGKYLQEGVAVVTAEAGKDDDQYRGTNNSEEVMDAFMTGLNFVRIREHKSPSYARDQTYVNQKFLHLLPQIFYLQHS